MKKLLAFLTILVLTGIAAAEDYSQIEQSFKKLLPTMNIDSITESPLPGVVEVVIDGQLVYASADGRYLIQGSLFDMIDRVDVTEASKSRLRKEAMKEMDLTQAIRFGPEKADHVVTVFTDIDCGYCRKLHQSMNGYNDAGITINYMFFPRAGIGSASYQKAVSVWCSDDQHHAMNQAKAGAEVEKKECENPVASQYQLGQKLGVSGTPAILTQSGELIPGFMPPEKLRARLDQLK